MAFLGFKSSVLQNFMALPSSRNCLFVCTCILLCFPGALLHELSNEGAREQFRVFVEEMILPQMCACAQVIPVL